VASLSSIRMPREALAVLQRVADLDEAHSEALIVGLSTSRARNLSALKGAVKSSLGDVWHGDDDIDSFIGHFMSMLALGGTHNFSTDELVKVIMQSARPVTEKEPANRTVLASRLAALLEAPDLVAVSKAADIVTEYDHVLHLSRIITDIRPVFGNSANNDPIGAVIVHQLRIGFIDENRVRTISFALDAQDLASLKRAVDRAADKQNALSSTLERAGVPEFDMTRKVHDE
jgi:hypothetical protein